MDLSVVPLHKHPEYLMACCRLINDEWKRSDAARIHSLEASCDALPTCLILLKNKTLIGHLKLTSIPSIKDACFVESVVIDRKLRGKGYGSILMKRVEEYCKDLSLNTIYLSTKGQELFYSKLGYTKCLPISIYGSYTPKTTTAPQQKTETDRNCCTAKSAPPSPPLPHSKPTTANVKTFMKKQIQ